MLQVQSIQSIYARRILAAHCLPTLQLYDVVHATTLACLLYAAPACWEFVSPQENGRIQSVMNRLIRLRYIPSDKSIFEQLCRHADLCLFSAMLSNPGHVLHRLLTPKSH